MHINPITRVNAVKKTPRHTANLQGRERQEGRVTKNLGLFQQEEEMGSALDMGHYDTDGGRVLKRLEPICPKSKADLILCCEYLITYCY